MKRREAGLQNALGLSLYGAATDMNGTALTLSTARARPLTTLLSGLSCQVNDLRLLLASEKSPLMGEHEMNVIHIYYI